MVDQESRRKAAIDQILVDIDEKLSLALQGIMQHESFVEMQSMWLGLNILCETGAERSNVYLEVLNISKDDMLQDFDEYLDLADSAMFFHLFKSEYDQAGGIPFGAMLLQYQIGNNTPDIHLLKQLSMVAAACHCPVITNADPQLFGRKHFSQLEQISDYGLLFNSQEYLKWRQLRERQDSRYLGLALPRVRVGMPGRQTFPQFVRCDRLRDLSRVWIHATYAVGMVLLESFHKHGWCVHIRGPATGGLVGPVIGADWGLSGFELREPPIELGLSDRQEQELGSFGFIPLTWHRERERICIFSAPSIQAGDQDRLAASLPYLFLVSRIAHYQKMIQRENIGAVKDSMELEQSLHKWLQGLVTKMPEPGLEVRSRFPLRSGSIKVTTDENAPGFFNVHLIVQPHLQLEGVNAQLTLVSKMPRKE